MLDIQSLKDNVLSTYLNKPLNMLIECLCIVLIKFINENDETHYFIFLYCIIKIINENDEAHYFIFLYADIMWFFFLFSDKHMSLQLT